MSATIPITFDERLGQTENFSVDEKGHATIQGATPGAIWWCLTTDGAVSFMRFACPSGCGIVGTIPVRDGYGRKWNWNGDKEKPTLSPSVKMTTPCDWHGWLRKGIWTR